MSSLKTALFAALLIGAHAAPKPKDVNLQLLRDVSQPQIACTNGEVACAESSLAGDWTATATLRFTQFDLDPTTGSAEYSGFIDIVVQDGKAKGSTTGQVLNGQLDLMGFTPDGLFPVYSVNSVIETSGGVGYFKKRECQFVNTGSIDPYRLPFGEMLDVVGTCTVIPGL